MKANKVQSTGTQGVSIYDTGVPGPTVGIMGGVHGDELTGRRVVENLKGSGVNINCGKLILITGNPKAVKKGVRFTEANLNRKFRKLNIKEHEIGLDKLPYEAVRAQELLPYLDECESLLDLHEHHSPKLGPFIICEAPSYEVAKEIGAPIISSGWSTSELGGSDGYMDQAGKPGICFELGYLKNTDNNMKLAMEVVNRFLSAHNMLKTRYKPLFPDRKTKYVKAIYSYIRKNKQFKFSRTFKSFQQLREGELIAEDGRKKIYAKKGEIIIFPREDNPIGTETFTIGRPGLMPS